MGRVPEAGGWGPLLKTPRCSGQPGATAMLQPCAAASRVLQPCYNRVQRPAGRYSNATAMCSGQPGATAMLQLCAAASWVLQPCAAASRVLQPCAAASRALQPCYSRVQRPAGCYSHATAMCSGEPCAGATAVCSSQPGTTALLQPCAAASLVRVWVLQPCYSHVQRPAVYG